MQAEPKSNTTQIMERMLLEQELNPSNESYEDFSDDEGLYPGAESNLIFLSQMTTANNNCIESQNLAPNSNIIKAQE